jgi:hypothetical protein
MLDIVIILLTKKKELEEEDGGELNKTIYGGKKYKPSEGDNVYIVDGGVNKKKDIFVSRLQNEYGVDNRFKTAEDNREHGVPTTESFFQQYEQYLQDQIQRSEDNLKIGAQYDIEKDDTPYVKRKIQLEKVQKDLDEMNVLRPNEKQTLERKNTSVYSTAGGTEKRRRIPVIPIRRKPNVIQEEYSQEGLRTPPSEPHIQPPDTSTKTNKYINKKTEIGHVKADVFSNTGIKPSGGISNTGADLTVGDVKTNLFKSPMRPLSDRELNIVKSENKKTPLIEEIITPSKPLIEEIKEDKKEEKKEPPKRGWNYTNSITNPKIKTKDDAFNVLSDLVRAYESRSLSNMTAIADKRFVQEIFENQLSMKVSLPDITLNKIRKIITDKK